jgi:hypothetical protein
MGAFRLLMFGMLDENFAFRRTIYISLDRLFAPLDVKVRVVTPPVITPQSLNSARSVEKIYTFKSVKRVDADYESHARIQALASND